MPADGKGAALNGLRTVRLTGLLLRYLRFAHARRGNGRDWREASDHRATEIGALLEAKRTSGKAAGQVGPTRMTQSGHGADLRITPSFQGFNDRCCY
jgi:hypothetical protein